MASERYEKPFHTIVHLVLHFNAMWGDEFAIENVLGFTFSFIAKNGSLSLEKSCVCHIWLLIWPVNGDGDDGVADDNSHNFSKDHKTYTFSFKFHYRLLDNRAGKKMANNTHRHTNTVRERERVKEKNPWCNATEWKCILK